MKRHALTAAGVTTALAFVGMVSGCNPNKDSGTVVTTPAAPPDAAAVQRQIQEVQNNPNIPPNQKQAIIGRLQSQMGETQARKASKNPAGGQAVPAAPK